MKQVLRDLRWLLWWQVAARVMRVVFCRRRSDDGIALGSNDGTWRLPVSSVVPGAVAYLGGAGYDISLDLELWRRGLVVRVFDPTPLAVAYVESVAPVGDPRFTLVRTGWWDSAGVLEFFLGAEDEHVSLSATNMFSASRSVSLPVNTVLSCMRELGDSRIDILKIDIEGAEKRVIRSILDQGPRPTVVCVEFDMPLTGVIRSIRSMKRGGYFIKFIEGWNYTFVRRGAPEEAG